MILYLTSKEHMNLLDFLMEKEEIVLPVKKMTGNFYFKKFVLYDMRNFSHCTELILDRIAFGDSDEEFIETITEFLAMYCARITVIWERLDEQKTFFDRLLVAGVTNIVAGSSANEVQSEIVQSLSREGMVKYHSRELKVATPATHYEFTAKGIRIALVGSQGRIGTTTVALGLSSWLGSVGAKICYVEKSDAGILPYLAYEQGMDACDGGFYLENVWYGKEVLNKECHFIIEDYGFGGDVVEADVTVLVCGVKSYEGPHTVELLKKYHKKGEYLKKFIICSFVNEKKRGSVADRLGDEGCNVLFMENYTNGPVDIQNEHIYRKVVEGYFL